jgi:hypothetical protein
VEEREEGEEQEEEEEGQEEEEEEKADGKKSRRKEMSKKTHHGCRQRTTLRTNPDGITRILDVRTRKIRSVGAEEAGADAEGTVGTFLFLFLFVFIRYFYSRCEMRDEKPKRKRTVGHAFGVDGFCLQGSQLVDGGCRCTLRLVHVLFDFSSVRLRVVSCRVVLAGVVGRQCRPRLYSTARVDVF